MADNKKKNKLSSQKALEKQAEQQKRLEQAMKKQQRIEGLKKTGIIVVCLVLVIALCIPAVALSLLH